MSQPQMLPQWMHGLVRGVTLFGQDVAHGLLVVSHNTLALLGLGLVTVAAVFATQTELRTGLERQALAWLSERHEARAESSGNTLLAAVEPDAAQRVTAADPRDLNKGQSAVAQFLSRRYKVAVEPVSRLVLEAWQAGERARIDPTLVLAVIAVESSFNPFAQSPVGAQGLMQVMTRVHDQKYEAFGGQRAAFDPVTNLKVGVQILKECIQRGGSVTEGLRYYVGAANLADDGGYAARVMFEQEQLKAVLAGRAPQSLPRAPAPVAPTEPAASAAEQVAQL